MLRTLIEDLAAQDDKHPKDRSINKTFHWDAFSFIYTKNR